MRHWHTVGLDIPRQVARLQSLTPLLQAIVFYPCEGRDPYQMYDDLCRLTGQGHDPCLLDTFIAAVRYMGGEPKKPWWKYTAERKREMAARAAPAK